MAVYPSPAATVTVWVTTGMVVEVDVDSDVEVWVELGGVDVPVESVVVVVGPQAATANEAAARTSNFNLFVFMVLSLLDEKN